MYVYISDTIMKLCYKSITMMKYLENSNNDEISLKIQQLMYFILISQCCVMSLFQKSNFGFIKPKIRKWKSSNMSKHDELSLHNLD